MILLVALVLFLKPIFPVIDFAINYNYISKVLCVNKAKPMMHCNGKCHLMKELAIASENEKSNSSNKKSNFQEQELLFFQEINPLQVVALYFPIKSLHYNNYFNLYTHLNCVLIFHPPTIIS